MQSTRAVLDHHLQCFGAADLDGIMADYDPGSVILVPEGAIRGLDAIRGFFAQAFAEFGKPGTTFDMKQVLVEGDCAFICWAAETPDIRVEAASDTFLVRDGRIAVQTYCSKVTPKGAS